MPVVSLHFSHRRYNARRQFLRLQNEEGRDRTQCQAGEAAGRQLDASASVWDGAASGASRAWDRVAGTEGRGVGWQTASRGGGTTTDSASRWGCRSRAWAAGSKAGDCARLAVHGDCGGRELHLRNGDGRHERGRDAAVGDGEAGRDTGRVSGWDCDGRGV
jgi:hypothetical protein